MIPLAPYTNAVWTPRHTMDRLQAVDQILGNIFSFAQDSPVFLQNGVLVKACGTSDAAKLVLDKMGNATAAALNVTVNVTPGPSIQVTQPAFGDGYCEGGGQGLQCVLKPSAGVAMSNTSVVEMSQFPVPPPLWTATLAVSGSPPPLGTAIDLQVLMSFNADNQTYMLYQRGSTKVQGCDG